MIRRWASSEVRRRVTRRIARGFNTIRVGNDKEQRSLYDIIGIESDDGHATLQRSPEEIRLAVVRKVKALRPDERPEDQRALEEILGAYKLLADPGFRQRYVAHHSPSPDATLHVLVDGGPHLGVHHAEHQHVHFTAETPSERSFGDFKEALLHASGDPPDSAAAAASSPKLNEPSPGADINFSLKLSFDEAVYGCHKELDVTRASACVVCRRTGLKDAKASACMKRPPKCALCKGYGKVKLPSGTYLLERPCGHCNGTGKPLPTPCSVCKGTGVIRGTRERVPVDIVPGTTTGWTAVVRGKGDCGLRGGAVGSLRITCLVEEHRLFHRSGNDLHIAIPIPLATALLGGVVQVPSLRGPTQVVVPAGAQHGTVISVHGAGVPAQGDAAGNLRVHLVVVIPNGAKLTGSQRNAVEMFGGQPFGAVPDNASGGHSREVQAVRCQLKQQLVERFEGTLRRISEHVSSSS